MFRRNYEHYRLVGASSLKGISGHFTKEHATIQEHIDGLAGREYRTAPRGKGSNGGSCKAGKVLRRADRMKRWHTDSIWCDYMLYA